MKRMLPALMIAMIWFMARPAFSQTTDSVSNEELQKYAVLMDSIDVMKQQLMDTINNMVQNNPKITAVRYNELYKVIGDTVKLSEASATPVEIAAVKEIMARKNEGVQKINDTFQSLARDYVGAATYNKVRKALASDGALKEKYDTLIKNMKEEESEGKKGQG